MTEDQLEQEALGWLAEAGYSTLFGPDIAPDGDAPERSDYRQVLLPFRLREAILRLNPTIPTAAREDALKQVLDLGIPVLLAANRHFHRLLITGAHWTLAQHGAQMASNPRGSSSTQIRSCQGLEQTWGLY